MILRLLLVFALVLTQLGAFSVGNGQTQVQRPVRSQLPQDLDWPLFFKTFREAVNQRDREALKKMMVQDFFFSGGSDENQDGDLRDEALKFLDDPQVQGWRNFAKTLAKGTAATRPNPTAEGVKYPTRVAPPAARKIKDLTNAPPWIATFEYRRGHWYCTSFSECCD